MEDEKEVTTDDSKVSKERMSNGKSCKKLIPIILLVIVIIAVCGYIGYEKFFSNDEKTTVKNDKKKVSSPYKMSGNSIENFDLYFLQLENESKNKIYSPLSIKYTLAMLSEGANGDSKTQISSIIGDYKSKKYTDSENMSFANALFVRDTYKDSIKSTYTDALSEKYNAAVVYDAFSSPDNLNKWVSDKTFGLINNLFDESVQEHNFFIVNALAIDMEWNKKIQATWQDYNDQYTVHYAHEDYSAWVDLLSDDSYSSIQFNNNSIEAKAVEIGASINNYDIVEELGEDNIRKTVGDEYSKWLTTDEGKQCNDTTDVDEYLDKYIKELDSNYKQIDTSTDFMLVNNDDIKAFAKDLKTYNGTTLQYVGIMPKNEELDSYISNIDADDINNVIKNLKSITNDNFTDGKVTKITGYIPLFKFDYQLKLKDDLKELGITDVFDKDKADLSGIVGEDVAYIDSASHKANIEFSNEGIKAAAATEMGGAGAVSCGFEYLYDVPVEEIDMTFDKPYLFLIRDKDTGEVWFVGTVYEPTAK